MILSNEQQEIIQKLSNRGIYQINSCDDVSEEKTIIVLGVARGGTSMVASILHNLDIPLGRKHETITYEDIVLSKALDKRQFRKLKHLVNDYNDEFKVWAWKRPSLIRHINKISKYFRNPHYIIVFKDIFSIANRNRISVNADVLDNMISTLNEYRKLVKFIQKEKQPLLLLSYDTCIRHKEFTVKKVADFVSAGDENQIERAIAGIDPDNVNYLNNTRTNRTVGCITDTKQNNIRGWVAYMHSNKSPILNLYLNNRLLDQNDFSISFTTKNRNSDNKLLYYFDITIGSRLLSADEELRLRVEDDVLDLSGSPVTLNPSV